MNKTLHVLYGLKWNPFTPNIPIEALYIPPTMESFIWRIENNHVQEGGFALIVATPVREKVVCYVCYLKN